VILRRQECGDVAVEDEVGLDRTLDRLDHLGIGLVGDLSHLAADRLLPPRQRVDVLVHARIDVVGHRLTSLLNLVSC
jgi:hypothetical protein